MMEMSLTLAHLYRRFDVNLADPNEPMILVQQFIMKPGKFCPQISSKTWNHLHFDLIIF
jgi:hypothetical protein